MITQNLGAIEFGIKINDMSGANVIKNEILAHDSQTKDNYHPCEIILGRKKINLL